MVDVISIVVSLILGGIIGYLISRHFYKKSEVFERDMRLITHSIQEIYMNTKFPHIFQPGAFFKDYSSEAPKDTDIPHLWRINCETNVVHPGGSLFFLIFFRDEGRNLLVSDGVEIINNLNQYRIPVSHEGFGWCSCNVKIPDDASSGTHKLIFELKDRNGKGNLQEFEYMVVEKE